ncbi:metalloendopeptidase, glycoprotease family [Chloroherpeton thalassium ATCC 35110]|uniref:tRNA N6-adenosine threonylcarbamoyltransferase n=1 Tax=Chloroherpeton thalassium (strain ATCC 35110 / GB-78) TaxID=517418 RepID=TSAD_CHLT3|nr:tRNA (adenosine(37)-N6)-threonylcarbamoyltransferase complex transferase subunit TsaD [Chloroherpeton thalassium]B3QYH8.1 RecName: Full=tRNA N6-adenosine threonylcarbamoyltransferase; AltName: Full=N6-L-threonylcarbamoyladenine synthase; Short=t(6)A synthase; AltName: Full=t(6)A37 threonylcarbamoyladenosine biosynthesis protein TsaD; AltName: Full=tRNA threonylcarbamoyladenosine biosynthesis protein TsaD [Chloroherpeton thalassium ATCC 35110]ACF13606.1 metalloendopeptidase, glycoprotease famil
MNILGIETSCDETSAAVLKNGLVASNIISSQLCHSEFGGVVPELASREHDRMVVTVVEAALNAANIKKTELDFIAATAGPGLIGAVLVGLSFGQALGFSLGKPFIPINHIDAHIFSSFINDGTQHTFPAFPFVSLTVSGGHTMLCLVHDDLRIEPLGSTIDDAAGEAFDKTGKMLGLNYPAGPVIDKLAQTGDPNFHQFPQALTAQSKTGNDYKANLDFSFSGLKTSVLRYLSGQKPEFIQAHLNDICASIQEAITSVLVRKTILAAEQSGVRTISVTGGVSANSELRRKFEAASKAHGFSLHIPKPVYSTDNAAMIATLAHLKAERGLIEPCAYNAPAFAGYEKMKVFRAR